MVDNNCIIEGNVKFRDGKKWKSRWCVMRKLSPVADCLHLQLYGDSKDRYKQGQTKASLSLQHFLGVQSGFTLDKESNTIAIICQDVTVVLAFDTRERLIQWQVKISNNLGEDRSFLVLISSAPAKAKLSTGPAQLHVQEHRFCMTVGVPPRLVGTWEIGQLRRYGVVEGRFCFEGGSRCGRGEGLHVLITDQAEDVVRALQLAAEGKLSTRCKRPVGLGLVGTCCNSLQDSPRRQFSSCVSFDEHAEPGDLKGAGADTASFCWSSTEGTDCETDYSRGSELGEQLSSDWQQTVGASAPCLERCLSCNSKLGGLASKSSVASGLAAHHLQSRAFDRISLSSYSSSSHESDYSCSPQPQPKLPAVAAVTGHRMSPSPLALPPRPPKPSMQQIVASKPNKPPMPLPPPTADPLLCTCSRKTTTPVRNGVPPGPYENYDIPKTLFPQHTPVSEQPSPQADLNYDTPRKIKESLAIPKAYPNYDIPLVPQAVVRQQCGCPAKLNSQTPKSLACPCHNVMSWAGFMLPYCRRGAGIEHTGVSMQPVRLSGEGKMPVMNASGKLGIYNSSSNGNIMETSQTLSDSSNDCECPVHPSESVKSNYENIEPTSVIDTQPEAKSNYANIDFTESLGNYENSKDFLAKVNAQEDKSNKPTDQAHKTGSENKSCDEEEPVCNKCGHFKESSQDYLIINEEEEEESSKSQHSSGYLPMQPAHNACSKEVLSRLSCGVKSSSNPALSGAALPLEANRKRSESEYRVPGSAMLSSPYFRRRLLEISNSENGNSLGMMLRKRSYSAESAHHLDDDKNSFTSTALVHKCPSDSEKTLASNQTAADSETEPNTDSPDTVSLSPQPISSIKIRRSSSVPSKTGHNRDSSSSNDSGVSTGSLSHRTTEFVEYEFPVTPANTLIKKQSVPSMYRKSPPPACFHSSLPRKSKSSDPLKELTFQFHKSKLPEKSSSAEADIPTCLPVKGSKEFTSPGEVPSVPYIDSRSTSSGTSDMSDYIETLSLSSHSSSDAPDNLRIGGKAVATTLRPRSGKEYYKIDRSILVDQSRTVNNTSSNYANFAPLTRKENQRQTIT